MVIVVSDTSIKNNVATSITHIHLFNSPLKKMLHHAIGITSTEAELFALRCGINQAVQTPGSSCIIVITDALHVVQKFFDSSIHLYQLQANPKTSKSSLMSTQRTLLNSGTALVTKSGTYMLRWIRKQKNSILFHSILAKHHGNSARKRSVTTSSKNGVPSSKHRISKKEISLIC